MKLLTIYAAKNMDRIIIPINLIVFLWIAVIRIEHFKKDISSISNSEIVKKKTSLKIVTDVGIVDIALYRES